MSRHVIQKRTEDYVKCQSLLSSQSFSPYNGVWRYENNVTQRPLPAAVEEMPSRNAFGPPVNEHAECQQCTEEISMQYYGAPSRSVVRQCEYSLTQQSAHAAATRLPPGDFRPPPDDFRPPARLPSAAGYKPAPKPLNIPHRP